MASQTRLIYEFGDFQLEPDERKLLRRGQIIPLHGKAFEMLLVLIRNRGRLLTKDELFQLVWPEQIVEESNLTVNMSAIRRALGERANSPHYITTVSGRGYRFTADVRQFAGEALTIERESFARVTVEQEETESTSLLPSAGQIAGAIKRMTSHPVLLSAVCVAVLAVAGVSIWVRGFHRAAPPLPWSNVTMRRFATQGGVPFRVAISPDGNSLVYRQVVGGKTTLWLGQIQTNSSVLIADQPGVSYSGLTFSREGQSIYVAEYNMVNSPTRLVRLPIVGGVPVELATHVDSAVTLSPDGNQLAFLRRDHNQSSIIVADGNAQNERTLATRMRPDEFSSSGLSWSPDGKYIAVASNKRDSKRIEILAISISDGSAKRISDRDWGFIGNVAWQPDGGGLLLTARNSSIARRSEIWFVPYPNGEPRKITNDLNQYLTETLSLSRNGTLAVLESRLESEIWLAPDGDASKAKLALQGVAPRYEGIDGLAWTPDGHLLYSAYTGDAQPIWEMNGDGSNPRQLTTNVGESVDRQMSVTADNRYVVFQSNRSGSFEIWRVNRDGTNLRQLTSNENSFAPSLSLDGKWIVYVSEYKGVSTLWRISIDGGEARQLTRNPSSGPEISPDGKHIAFLESSDSMPLHLAITSIDGQPENIFPLPPVAPINLAKRMCWMPDSKAILYKNSAPGLWRQRLDRAAPEMVKGFEDVNIYQLDWSFDGKSLAYTRGANMQEIILLQSNK